MSEDLRNTVLAAARTVARLVAPRLETRLESLYGGYGTWLHAVNALRAHAGLPPGRGLHDHRFCLAVLGYDKATEKWAEERWRRQARELNALANKAAHDEPLTVEDANRATRIAKLFRTEYVTAAEGTHIGSALEWANEQIAAEERWINASHEWIIKSPGDTRARQAYALALAKPLHGAAYTDLAERLLAFLDNEWPDSDRDPIALCCKAHALVALDQCEQAALLARRAVDLDSSNLDAWSILAWISNMVLEDYETGAIAARRILRANKRNEWAKYQLANALYGLGREEEGHAAYQDD
jgi:hypothetical protein